MTLKIEFKTPNNASKVLVLSNSEIEKFYAVLAEDEICETADGRVLLAAAVVGIPTADWTGDVRISLVTTGSENAQAAYSAMSDTNAFNN